MRSGSCKKVSTGGGFRGKTGTRWKRARGQTATSATDVATCDHRSKRFRRNSSHAPSSATDRSIFNGAARLRRPLYLRRLFFFLVLLLGEAIVSSVFSCWMNVAPTVSSQTPSPLREKPLLHCVYAGVSWCSSVALLNLFHQRCPLLSNRLTV